MKWLLADSYAMNSRMRRQCKGKDTTGNQSSKEKELLCWLKSVGSSTHGLLSACKKKILHITTIILESIFNVIM